MSRALQGALEAVEAGQRDAGRRPRTSARKAVGRPEITATSANGTASSARRAGTPGSGRAPRVLDDGRQRPVEIEEQRAARRLGRQRPQQFRQARRGVARRGQRQVVVVVAAARSAPMTTTTSMPVTPVTGVDVVSGSTWAGLTPMVVAMDPACCCWPAT